MYLGYQFLLFSSEKGGNRGGTFVEAIFDNVSYLPYWGVNANDSFYQSKFFMSCMIYSEGTFENDMCDVTTEDNKTFTVNVKEGYTWSDGFDISVDDVFFTYNEIIKDNLWQISYLDVYDVITISRKEDNSLVIQFPFASVDNFNFFTQYILPQHVVSGMSLEEYKTDFAQNPVYGGCARIHGGAKDSSSLVFELSECDTNILYYQLKSFESPNDFLSYVNEAETHIVSLYSEAQPLVGYDEYDVLTDKYMTIFFNNESNHLNHSIRRALGGLINETFYTGQYNDYFFKDQLLFETFWSQGGNLENHIINKNPRLDINKDGLERINIQKVPKTVELTWDRAKIVYYLDVIPESGKFGVYFKTQKPYERIIISHEGTTWTITLPYNKDTGKYQYVLELDKNLAEGLNKYSVKWYNKDKIDTIADMDLYYLNLPDVDEESRAKYIEQKGKIKVIYFKDYASEYVAESLQKIFADHTVDQYFNFVGFDTPQEFDTKLLSKDYDIVISPFDFARRKDFSSLLLTDVPTINPSLYTNPTLANYISDYVHKSEEVKESLKAQINDVYANDMPFVVLGQMITPFYIKERYAVLPKDVVYTVETFKKELVESIEIVKNARLSKEKIFSWTVIKEFVNYVFE